MTRDVAHRCAVWQTRLLQFNLISKRTAGRQLFPAKTRRSSKGKGHDSRSPQSATEMFHASLKVENRVTGPAYWLLPGVAIMNDLTCMIQGCQARVYSPAGTQHVCKEHFLSFLTWRRRKGQQMFIHYAGLTMDQRDPDRRRMVQNRIHHRYTYRASTKVVRPASTPVSEPHLPCRFTVSAACTYAEARYFSPRSPHHRAAVVVNHQPLSPMRSKRLVASTRVSCGSSACWLVMFSTQITQAMSPAT